MRSHMGKIAAGRWLEVVVSVDAFLVLAGSVITAFVGMFFRDCSSSPSGLIFQSFGESFDSFLAR